MQRVVFDSNIVVSGTLWSGVPRQALQLASNQLVQAIASEAIIDELRDVLHRPKFEKYLKRLELSAEDAVSAYLTYTQVIEPEGIKVANLRDPDDAAILACAMSGKANCIVTGDDDLLSLKQYQNIPIRTAKEFLESLNNTK